jgi:hypothetical protein
MEWIMLDLTKNEVQERLENVVLSEGPATRLFQCPRHVCFGLFCNVKVNRAT